MKINYYKTIRVMTLINMVFFFILNSIIFIIDTRYPEAYIASISAIAGAIGYYFNIKYYELGFLFSSVLYAHIAFTYYLIGEGIANIVICVLAHIIILHNNITNKSFENNYFLSEKTTTTYNTLMTLFSVFTISVLYRLLVLTRSTFADWESASIVVLCWSFYFEIRKDERQWFFWLIRNTILIYIWFFINDRIHIQLLWVFQFTNSVFAIILFILKKYNEKNI